MDGAGAVNKKYSSEDDLKQFDKLFLELVTESTTSDDPKLVDAMTWFKRASTPPTSSDSSQFIDVKRSQLRIE